MIFFRLFSFLLVCICIISASEAIADNLKFYSESDLKIKELCKRVEKPSSESKNVESEITGQWIYIPEISDSLPNVVWHTLNFKKEGVVEYTYELKSEKKIVKKSGTYELYHKGSSGKFPGKAPSIIVKHKDLKDKNMLPFIDVCVDYDSRIPMELGKILKFKDFDGKQHCFVKQKEVGRRSLL